MLDAFGRDVVMLETMGVGQVETRIRFAADTVVVVLTPEAGDEVQSLKAGLLEVADIFVVNKADRAGADALVADLTALAGMRSRSDGWSTPVLATSANRDDGIAAVESALVAHETHLAANGRREARRRQGLAERVRALVDDALRRAWWQDPTARTQFDAMVERVSGGAVSPHRAARDIAAALRVAAPTSQ